MGNMKRLQDWDDKVAMAMVFMIALVFMTVEPRRTTGEVAASVGTIVAAY